MAFMTAVLCLFFVASVSAYECNEGFECCEYPMQSSEFNACCNKHGCCPRSCDNVLKDTMSGIWSVHTGSVAFLECCVYDQLSPEYLACCKKHNFCPDCTGSSRNCCYNGTTVGFGEVVTRIPECCTKLVCGARVSSTRPFVTAVIVPVETPPIYGTTCGTPEFSYCVQTNGIIRMEGSEWFETPCRLCRCDGGVVTCRPVKPVCPPAPQPHCRQIPAECCPLWDCSEQIPGCRDNTGIQRQIGEVWNDPTNPCYTLTCTHDGIQRDPISCPFLPSPPHQSCTLERINCCYNWTCQGCVDESGEHPEGSTWQHPSDECIVNMCIDNIIRSVTKYCPTLPPPPHSGCTRVKVDCCDEWNCPTGCVDNTGTQRQVGENWPDPTDPCYTLTCTSSGIQRDRIPCPSLPPPPSSDCTLEHQPNCCYNWTCPQESGCLDSTGTQRQVGETWEDPTDPCYTLICTMGGIQRSRIICPSLPVRPQPDCTLVTINCCYNWTCPSTGCVDETGTTRPIGDMWEDPADPCYTFNCTPTGIERIRTPCPDLPDPPRPDCRIQHLSNCCYNWTCPTGCVDDQGISRDIGETWEDPADPCYTFTCTENGITRSRTICPSLPNRPHPSCTLVNQPNCCYNWSCSDGCVDENGVPREEGSMWTNPSDPCTNFVCKSGVIIKFPVYCPQLPPQPHSGCIKTKVGCCEGWNCTGCVDQFGVFHEEGSSWSNPFDPCETHMCTDGNIVTFPYPCPPLPPKPHFNCINITVGCCQQWECPTTGCTDLNGQPRSIGEEWTEPSVPCETFKCTSSGIVRSPIECPPVLPPPHPYDCNLVKKNCCYEWNCTQGSVCADYFGNPRNIGDTWKHISNPCMERMCLQTGVVDVEKSCPYLPPKPAPNCVPKLVDCCEEWDCRPQCPDSYSHNMNCVDYYNQCSSDADCIFGKICCLVATCGWQCIQV